jgi:hypothetical protein
VTAPVEEIRAELLTVVEGAIRNHPRSLQTRIGPSEIGDPCARKIAYKLAGAPVVNGEDRTPWKPTVGTAVHSWLQDTLMHANTTLPDYDATGGRYWCEVRVDVGEILGQPITGSCDLRYDNISLDYKIVGDDQLRKYKTEGPGPQYRVQGHLYGRGWARRGQPVDYVAVWFLPRNQELRQNHLWVEPYDEQIAIDALTRVEGIAKLVQALGAAAAAMLPPTENWCVFCPFFRPGSKDLTAGCPGVIDATVPSPSLASLIAK